MKFHQSSCDQECWGNVVPPLSSQRCRQQINGLGRRLGVLFLPGYRLGQLLHPFLLLLLLLESFLESFLQLDGRTAEKGAVSDRAETFLRGERGGGEGLSRSRPEPQLCCDSSASSFTGSMAQFLRPSQKKLRRMNRLPSAQARKLVRSGASFSR